MPEDARAKAERMDFPSLFGATRYCSKRKNEIVYVRRYSSSTNAPLDLTICSLSTRRKTVRARCHGGVDCGPGLKFCRECGWTFFFPLQPLTSFAVQHHLPILSLRILCPTTNSLYLPSSTRRRHGPSRVTTRMPRRKAADPPSHKRRSRNGCVNCKRRKIRCDEGSPSCGYCRARSLTCSRGGVVLKWEADYADNGLAFGRQGVGPAAVLQG